MRERFYLNNSWNYRVLPSHHATVDNMQAVRETVKVRRPHTVRELPYDYFNEKDYQFISSYEKKLTIPGKWKNKRLILIVEGAAHEADVYVNEQALSRHFCGYTAFRTDITDAVRFGTVNSLEIVINSRESVNQPPFGYVVDYLAYGGLYREVYLDVCDELRLEDIFINGNMNGDFRTTFRLGGETDKISLENIEAELSLSAQDGTRVYQTRKKLSGIPSYPVKYLESNPTIYEMSGSIHALALWSTENPNLYNMTLRILKNDACLDEVTTRMGFRTAEFKADGFYLNGSKLFLRGLNRHQSYPYVGYAMPRSMQEWDADILKKELGVNYVRTSHYPQSQYFVDRCDELGILVFTEIPGWQHIGGNTWKNRAIQNVEDMVLQYRNHPSIFLWGVRINESADDDAFYKRTNSVARRLDPTRATGGVRNFKGSHLLEDVYTFNDFSHTGANYGVEKKKAVTPDMNKAYMITEFNGHMFPTKMYDDELHRQEQAIRHANVLDSAMAEGNIAGASGWCMFDYNTHKDFGSGDKICYHGVMDMYRNPKLAAYLYQSQQDEETVLQVGSNFDIGEHPAGNLGQIYIFTNAERVKMYKNDRLLKEYSPADSPYKHLPHPPILIDDYIGTEMGEKEGFAPDQEAAVKYILNYSAVYGFDKLPPKVKAKAGRMMLKYHMNFEDAYRLFGKYIGNWGQEAVSYRFEAYRNNMVTAVLEKSPMKQRRLQVLTDHVALVEDTTYDVAAIRVRMTDQLGNVLPFYQGSAKLHVTGPVELIGPDILEFRGGCGGTFIRTKGKEGKAELTISAGELEEKISFTISVIDRKLNMM